MPHEDGSLNGSEREQFREILLKAYGAADFAMMLQEKLDIELTNIITVSPFSTYTYNVFQVIQQAQQKGWIYKLLAAVREDRADRADVIEFSQKLGVAPSETPRDDQALEKIIDASNAILDVMIWRTKLAEIEGRVCRVEIKGEAKGTGFLVGPDKVLTNWHVVYKIKDEPASFQPSDIVLRFDYKRLPDGPELSPGKEYGLVTTDGDWLIDHSPWSEVDLESDPKSGDPDAEELDHALLRVDGTPGDDALGEKVVPGSPAPPRGIIKIPKEPHAFVAETPLFIVQHPDGAPLKLALDMKAVISLRGQDRRVRYRTNTEGGSSGSPVFDQNWNLVALHHSGDPKSFMPTYNEGIPINLIRERLIAKGAL